MKRTSTKPIHLPESLHQRLNSYALAASAAGVGVLSLARPAEAKIIYTRAHINCSLHCQIHLVHDQRANFEISWGSPGGGYQSTLRVLGNEQFGSKVVATKSHSYYASALRAGVRVNTGNASDAVMAGRACFQPTCTFFGQWANGGKGVKNRYLGLKFIIKGKYHFGWARLSVTETKPVISGWGATFGVMQATLTGYAYETIPNKPIIAGKTHGKDVVTVEPATLGYLAGGASAIPAWRQKE